MRFKMFLCVSSLYGTPCLVLSVRYGRSANDICGHIVQNVCPLIHSLETLLTTWTWLSHALHKNSTIWLSPVVPHCLCIEIGLILHLLLKNWVQEEHYSDNVTKSSYSIWFVCSFISCEMSIAVCSQSLVVGQVWLLASMLPPRCSVTIPCK